MISSWMSCFVAFSIAVAIASAQASAPFLDQVPAHHVFTMPSTHNVGYFFNPVSFISNSSLPNYPRTTSAWHPRKVNYQELVNIIALQPGRLHVVAHPELNTKVLMKIASAPSELPSLEQEATMYKLLHGSDATPEFLGHVTSGNRVVGFITEYIEEAPFTRQQHMQSCLDPLRLLHGRGIAHGDAHDGNCLIRKDGTAVLIDFELSLETWSHQEFERDLDIMSLCIQEISGS